MIPKTAVTASRQEDSGAFDDKRIDAEALRMAMRDLPPLEAAVAKSPQVLRLRWTYWHGLIRIFFVNQSKTREDFLTVFRVEFHSGNLHLVQRCIVKSWAMNNFSYMQL
jgi:hypothetical protein